MYQEDGYDKNNKKKMYNTYFLCDIWFVSDNPTDACTAHAQWYNTHSHYSTPPHSHCGTPSHSYCGTPSQSRRIKQRNGSRIGHSKNMKHVDSSQLKFLLKFSVKFFKIFIKYFDQTNGLYNKRNGTPDQQSSRQKET